MNKRFCVLSSRADIPELLNRFPKMMTELSDLEIVELIIEFGRAEIKKQPDGTIEIEFQNDYD